MAGFLNKKHLPNSVVVAPVRLRRLFILLISVFWAGSSGAQLLSGPVPVRDVLARAEKNSPELGRLRALLRAERARRLGALGIENPQIVYAREGITTSAGGFTEQRWVLQQSIDSPLETLFDLKGLAAERTALEQRIEMERIALRERVRRTYVDFVVADERLQLRQQVVMLADSLLRIISARIEAGAAGELERLRVQLEQAIALEDRDAAVREREEVCLQLIAVVGDVPAGNRCDLEPADSLRFTIVDVPAEMNVQIGTSYPALAMADASVQAARFRVRSARGAFWPRIHVNYWPQDFGDGFRFHGFEVGFSVPIWSIFNQQARYRTALAEEQVQLWNRQEVQVTLAAEQSKAWARLAESRAAVERFLDTTGRQLDETVRLMRRAFEVGEIGLVRVLDAQRTYIDLRARSLETLRRYYQDLINLEKFLGRELVF